MGRIFSLRGNYSLADNALGQHLKIFDYISPDRTRAWKVIEAWICPRDFRAEIGGSDGQICVQAHLSTDEWILKEFDEILNVSDNRQCAWFNQQFVMRAGTTDFIAPANGQPMGGFGFCDPDTVVVKELFLAMSLVSESTTSPTRDWNYVVILEEMKITSSESVLQQVKGIGQDVSN